MVDERILTIFGFFPSHFHEIICKQTINIFVYKTKYVEIWWSFWEDIQAKKDNENSMYMHSA